MSDPGDDPVAGPDWEELSHVLVDLVRTAVASAPDALTPVQLRCLEVLSASGGRARVSDLAEALGVVASSASRLVDRLVALGLVSRRQARASRREVDVSLTGAGRRAVQRSTAAVTAALETATAGMAEGDREALRRGLAALGASVTAPARGGAAP
ncbi:MarR family winged helix-turn-helix transcriptional regulator [Pseudokineococcus marinus]